MPTPRFQVGDRVTPNTNRDNLGHGLGVFLILKTMPFDRIYGFQYRAESTSNKGLRVFLENELMVADDQRREDLL